MTEEDEKECAKTAAFMKELLEDLITRAEKANHAPAIVMYVTACISLSAFMSMKRDEGGVEHALNAMTSVINKAMQGLDMGEANCRVASSPEEMAVIASELEKAMNGDEPEYETGIVPDAVH